MYKLKRPLHDNVVIKQHQKESESQYGNLIIPDEGKEKSMIGEVIAIGPGRQNMEGNIVPTTLKVGEIVTFPSFGGSRIFLNQEEFFVYKEADIFAVLENE